MFKTALRSVLVAVLSFLGPVAGSIQGFLSPAEVSRCFVAAATGSTLAGSIVAVLGQLGADAAAVPNAPIGVALVSFLAIHLEELMRRFGQHKFSAELYPPDEPEPAGADVAKNPFAPANLGELLRAFEMNLVPKDRVKLLMGFWPDKPEPKPGPVAVEVEPADGYKQFKVLSPEG